MGALCLTTVYLLLLQASLFDGRCQFNCNIPWRLLLCLWLTAGGACCAAAAAPAAALRGAACMDDALQYSAAALLQVYILTTGLCGYSPTLSGGLTCTHNPDATPAKRIAACPAPLLHTLLPHPLPNLLPHPPIQTFKHANLQADEVMYWLSGLCAVVVLPISLGVDGTDWGAQFRGMTGSDWAALLFCSFVAHNGSVLGIQVRRPAEVLVGVCCMWDYAARAMPLVHLLRVCSHKGPAGHL